MPEFVPMTNLIPGEGGPEQPEFHDPQLATEFASVVLEGMGAEAFTAPEADTEEDRTMFGADLMSGLLDDPDTARNFSMTRSGGAWGENE